MTSNYKSKNADQESLPRNIVDNQGGLSRLNLIENSSMNKDAGGFPALTKYENVVDAGPVPYYKVQSKKERI
jgi:hypothetical protein